LVQKADVKHISSTGVYVDEIQDLTFGDFGLKS